MTAIRDYQEKVKRAREVQEAEKQLVEKQEEAVQHLAEDQEKYNLLALSMQKDLARVSSLPQGRVRNEFKRDELIPKYRPYVDAYIALEEVYRNEILTQVMIWAFDAGDIHYALELAEKALEEKQPMPKRFKRTTIAYISDAFLEWAKTQYAMGDSVQPYFEQMFDKVMEWPIHDEIKMKYCKFAGELMESKGENGKAYMLYEKAYKLCPLKAKVKTKLDKLSKS